MKRNLIWLQLLFIFIGTANTAFAQSQHTVVVQIDGTIQYQRFEGIGGSFTPFETEGIYKVHDPAQPESVTVTAAQKDEIARLLYKELGIARTRFVLRGFEPANDNDDPLTLNPAGFEWITSTVNANIEFLKIGRAYGLQNGWLSFALDGDHRDAWRRLSNSPCALDPAQVDEEVEWLWAAVLHLRDSGIDVRYMAINNEPDLCPPGYKIEIADMVTIIKRLGARLRQEGLTTQIVVSDGWIPQNAFLYMQAALSDPEARQYVGALAYHSYDAYDNLDVLRHAAEGIPPHDAAEIRRQIRNLAAQYHLPVWMTEVCYCAPRDGMSYFDLAVGRLNHLFDELTITNVSAFDVMNTAFIERPNVGDELVHYYFRSDGTLERSEISVYGRLVGHFSRFVPVGSVRIEASSSNPVVRVVPFARPDGQWVVILLNNTKEAVDVQLKFHQTVSTRFAVLTSQTDSLWQSGPGVSSTDLIHMQPRSIMTLSSQP